MGQALRRASGRVRPSAVSSPPPAKAPSQQPKAAAEKTPSASQDHLGISDSDTSVSAKDGHATVLEEKDPSYNKMLSFMAGRITSKPGGRAEMGEASIRESYGRPLPKVRSSKANVEESAQRSLTPGTLSIEHIHQIILLHQGKSNGQQGPMETKEIAERFHVDTIVIEKIVQSISLPQEEDNNNKSEG
ncbi:dynein beta chain, ciliary protein [Carex rostrata]